MSLRCFELPSQRCVNVDDWHDDATTVYATTAHVTVCLLGVYVEIVADGGSPQTTDPEDCVWCSATCISPPSCMAFPGNTCFGQEDNKISDNGSESARIFQFLER